ncbi:MAG: selB [Conexibacter sp.]|nr:selB [Conexibacter sp.]
MSERPPPLTLGTAGHIDHGKTALIAALTGIDTDRLPEEQARGISIELGYASLTLPTGRRLSVIDVPGHERFVRTMVAGATGIDLFLMTIAADDGVMPQTREHAAVLAGLGVSDGVVAITKADLAGVDVAAVRAAAAELLPGVEAVVVSARARSGLDELRAALEGVAARLPGRATADAAGGAGAAVLHVDRAFTIRGAGTVVTGTLWSGAIGRGDELVLLPAGRRVRVRGVQVHDASVERAAAGQRVAVNLTGVALDAVARGDVLAAAQSGLAATYRLDAAIRLPPEVDHGDRVQVHHGTRASPARLAALGGRYWQLRLEQPLVAAAGDRVVVRRVAPPDTLGGGVVLDAAPPRHGPSRDLLARLARIERGEPADPGARDADAAPPPSAPPLDATALALAARLHAAGWEPPLDAELSEAERAALPALREAGRAVRIGRAMHAHPDPLVEVRERVVAHIEAHGSISLGELRDLLGTSRKFAQALLEHLDAERVTRRDGERRVLRRRPPTSGP